jgi:hypothetical protein
VVIDFLRNQSVVEVGLVHRHPSSPAEGLAEGRLSGHPDYFGIVRETENAFVARVSAPSERGDTNNNKENEDTRKAIRRGIRSLSLSLSLKDHRKKKRKEHIKVAHNK